MRKFLIGFTTCLLVTTPLLVFSAPNLAERLKGKILLAVEDKGKTYYVHEDGNRYRITVATAQKIFEKLALGITNSNLDEIPLNDVGIEPESSVCANTSCPVCPVCADSQTECEPCTCDFTCDPEIVEVEKIVYVDTCKEEEVYSDYILKVQRQNYVPYNSNEPEYKIFEFGNDQNVSRTLEIREIVVQPSINVGQNHVRVFAPHYDDVYDSYDMVNIDIVNNKWFVDLEKNWGSGPYRQLNEVPFNVKFYVWSIDNPEDVTYTPIYDEWVIWDTTVNKRVKIEY